MSLPLQICGYYALGINTSIVLMYVFGNEKPLKRLILLIAQAPIFYFVAMTVFKG
jgi:hypothetical protein